MSLPDFFNKTFSWYRANNVQPNPAGQAVNQWDLKSSTMVGGIQPASSKLIEYWGVQGVEVSHAIWTSSRGFKAGDKFVLDDVTYLFQGEQPFDAQGTIDAYSVVAVMVERVS
jgi:hypothetical protein